MNEKEITCSREPIALKSVQKQNIITCWIDIIINLVIDSTVKDWMDIDYAKGRYIIIAPTTAGLIK